ncbi:MULTISPECIES: nitroreductase family protein [unclassified Paenibacillus]|uniref:nitroreductase family protein n=1 Tax=unclassified Paenibacillus TaxID=185978 RepID=UPI0010499FE4|nr:MULTISPECIES: nitroreductase family protein [unclassified Paenibacillus]NIK69363.1 nitroreductase [Paenibacillus sp. BK720]TCM92679.1 nitroreductase [Paenibacillus sp. BK033]
MSSTVFADFYAIIRERHSVKHYDAAHRLNEKEIIGLLEIASQAPSAWNLQHWRYLSIHSQAAKEKLLPIAYGQKQVVEASVVIAVLGDLEAHRNAEDVFGPDVEAGLMTEDIKASLIDQIDAAYGDSPAYAREEAIRNASLAAMQLMLAAKAKGLDSCPMGGFSADAFIEAFHIPSRYIPVMLIAIGKAAAPARASLRFPVEQTIVWNGFQQE